MHRPSCFSRRAAGSILRLGACYHFVNLGKMPRIICTEQLYKPVHRHTWVRQMYELSLPDWMPDIFHRRAGV